MTLEELLKCHRHKKVFNFIYKTFLSSVREQEVERIDSLFYSFWRTLSETEARKTTKKDFLFITEIQDDLHDPPIDIVDVSIYYSDLDELDLIDFVDWRDLLSLNIKNSTSLADFEILCYVLYEIFLFGFSTAEVEKRNKSHRTNWNEIEKELKDIFDN